MYAIVDIETTGATPGYHRITEVAIYVYDGEKIIEKFETLINPGKWIPRYINALTGITNEMTASAPVFSDVAQQINDILSDKIFVAHNVNFDYGFLAFELEQCGIKLSPKKLCTVRLSRKIFPGFPSYSLGRLCSQLGIPLINRHRAGGDATATVTLFNLLLKRDKENFIEYSLSRHSGEAFLPPHLNRGDYESLSQKAGVYYFLDKKGKVIYVGKAKNIKKRVQSHFNGNSESRAKREFMNNIYSIKHEICGSELISFLKESHEIKKHWPKYNQAQKTVAQNFGIYQYYDGNGFIRLAIGKVVKASKPLMKFQSQTEALSFLWATIREFILCPKLCGIQQTHGECLKVEDFNCKKACQGTEPKAEYNNRASTAINSFSKNETYAIIGEGRFLNENSIVLVEKGKYLGFGFTSKENLNTDFETLKSFIDLYTEYPIVRNILNTGVRNNKEKVLNF